MEFESGLGYILIVNVLTEPLLIVLRGQNSAPFDWNWKS